MIYVPEFCINVMFDLKINKSKTDKRNSLEGLAVVDDGDHILNVALRELTVFQMFLLIGDRLLSVPSYTCRSENVLGTELTSLTSQ